MVRKTLTAPAVAITAALLLSVAASTADAQYRYGGSFNSGYGSAYGNGYSVGTSRLPRGNFNDYFANRLRQRQIQQYYGTPYYPRYDNNYYGQQRRRSYTYRPDYEGRQFRSSHDDTYDRYDRFDNNRYDDYRDRNRRSQYRFGY